MKDTVKKIKTVKEAQDLRDRWKAAGYTVGLVPTMGYLHRGHGSLIKRAASENDKVIVSIFVNPMQFSQGEDLERYPRDPDRDRKLCQDLGAHAIFHPDAEEVYPPGFCTHVDVAGPSQGLCGDSRKGMFRGVATVVLKLLLITGAHRAYFGQKDAQQLAVVTRMAKDLNVPVEIIGCPVVREEDGLALSSRNVYLNREERIVALCLPRALELGQELIRRGERNSKTIVSAIVERIAEEPTAKIDYVQIVDPTTIDPIEKVKTTALCAAAVFIGKTRLIDNFYWDSTKGALT